MDKKGTGFLNASNNLITRNLSLLISAIIMIVSLILLPGCGTTLKDVSSSGESTDVKLLKPQSLPVYYDFEDISIPPELTLDKEKSFIYETSALKTGILVFKGRIDVSSLVAFFQENMKKNNWVFINSFKYKGYILNFQKEDKSCLITLFDRAFNTIVEVRVGPLHGTVEEPK
ncbi:MAG: hypothetical protein AB1401_07345 [Thermodesulfobacteriota bacterium]